MDRSGAVSEESMTELSPGIVPPGPYKAVLADSQGVVLACGDPSDAGQARRLHGAAAIDARSIAELALNIVTPTPYGAVAADSQRVVGTCSEGGHIGQAGYLH